MATIAFCGLGMMGSQMAARLRDAGHNVRVWNRTMEKAKAWVANGGVLCESPEDAGHGASEGHLMLADDAAVNSTLFGPRGLLSGLSPGALVVDHSTVSVAGTKDRAGRLIREGWRYLHGPVLAGPPQVAQGQGLMLIAGLRSVYDESQATLHEIITQHYWVGEKPEDAAAFKLMANSMFVSVVEALAEYFAIARVSGIAAQRAFSLFDSFDACGTISRRGPRMVRGDYKPTFTLSMGLKDVELMLQAAGNEARVPSLKVIEAKMKQLVAAGCGELDIGILGTDSNEPSK